MRRSHWHPRDDQLWESGRGEFQTRTIMRPILRFAAAEEESSESARFQVPHPSDSLPNPRSVLGELLHVQNVDAVRLGGDGLARLPPRALRLLHRKPTLPSVQVQGQD